MAPSISGLFHDDAIYTVLAKSLAEGNGYTLTGLPSSPAQAKYPFLYPYILSWIWWLEPSFPDNLWLLKLFNFVMLFAALLFAWSLHRHYLPNDELGALLSLFLLGTNIYVTSTVRLLMTEMLFLNLVLCGLWLTKTHSSIRVALLALVSAASYLTRTSGVALLISALVATALRADRRRTMLFATLAAAVASPWVVWQKVHIRPPGNPLLQYYITYDFSSIAYVALWQDPTRGLNILIGNARYVLDSFDESLLLQVVPGLRFVIYAFVVLGALRLWRERAPILKLFVFIYLGLIVSWPWHPSRFFLHLVPVVLLLIFCGIAEGHRRLQRPSMPSARTIRALLLAPVAAVSVIHIAWFSGYLAGRIPAPPAERMEAHWPGFLETFAWIRQHTAPNAILASGFDQMYYLYTQRRGVRPWFYRPESYFYPYGRAIPDLGDHEEIRRALRQLGVTHLIVDPLDIYAEQSAAPELFRRLITVSGTTLEPLFQSSDGLHKVYALPHDAATPLHTAFTSDAFVSAMPRAD